MRRAMAEAEVGDDGSGEDPTVNELEADFAARVGKEAAVFLPSGTMGNQIALRLLGRPGTRVIAGATQHVVGFELAAAGDERAGAAPPGRRCRRACSTRAPSPTPSSWRRTTGREASARLRREHPHGRGRRAVGRSSRFDAVAALGLPVHLDGARLFNAEVATGIDAATFAAPATTVMCCLSKGLGAPVGSLLAGSATLMDGPGRSASASAAAMRQAGVLAAPGLVALRDHVEPPGRRPRPGPPPGRGRRRALAGQRRPGPGSDQHRGGSPPDAAEVLDHLAADGVLAGTVGPGRLRFVTHLDVDDDGIDRLRAKASSPDGCAASRAATGAQIRPRRASRRWAGLATRPWPAARARRRRRCRPRRATAPMAAPMAAAVVQSPVHWRSTKPKPISPPARPPTRMAANARARASAATAAPRAGGCPHQARAGS